MVQTRYTYALEAAASPPLELVTSVRAILTRGAEVMVVRDPGGEHIVPRRSRRRWRGTAGCPEAGTVGRNRLERPRRAGAHRLLHFHILSPKPARYRYPYPDFLQLLYKAEADRYFPEEMEVGGFELGAAFRSHGDVQRLPLTAGELALLLLLPREGPAPIEPEGRLLAGH